MKIEAIVNSMLAPHAVQAVIKSLQGIPFCRVSTDASNHGAVKIFPILIHYFNYENGGLEIKLLEVESKPNATAHTVAASVSETVSNYGLLSKCVAYAGDNCNTMFGGLKKGGGKNVLANLKNIIKPSLIGIGCPAHVLNNCIQHGTDTLETDME
jgi:phage tail sheath gpL-like